VNSAGDAPWASRRVSASVNVGTVAAFADRGRAEPSRMCVDDDVEAPRGPGRATL